MTGLVVKLNPYNAPFKPPSEPGVYWLDQQYAGDCLHDAHVSLVAISRRRIPFLRSVSFVSVARRRYSAPASSDVLSDCGLPHLAGKGAARTHFIPNAEFMADLSRDGVKAARRYLKNQGQK